ncbi:MAG: substrate-binding domain-containing protein [Methylophilaceae bacterium]|nr:substrate-binding domain-containing protein [Methylophilaceae bacterium]
MMHNPIKKMLAIVAVTLFASQAWADEGNELQVDMDAGRGGLPVNVEDPSEFRVCADYDNLPFSNGKMEGFENKIAELIAKDLGKKVKYQFWYDRIGFIRNTLNAYRCDVVMGTVTGNDMMLTTKPYYRSGYVFVYKKSSGYNITDWDSPDLRKAKIGLVGMTPPSRPIADKELMGNARPYRLMRDLNLPPSHIIDDLVKGEIDVAILWGPIAGYWAKTKYPDQLVIVPAPEYEQENPHGKEQWNISVGVRKKEKERAAMIEAALERNKAEIEKILDDYGIPRFPIVDEKKEKEKKSAKDKTQGDIIPKSE